MAVSNTQNPNLESSYGNVLQQLQNRSTLELKRSNLANAGAEAVNTINQQNLEYGKIYLQHKLNMDLESMRQKFESRGDVLVTPEIKDNFKKEFGVDLPVDPGTHLTAESLGHIQDSIEGGLQKFHSKKVQTMLSDPHPEDPKWKGKLASELMGSGDEGRAAGQKLVETMFAPKVSLKLDPVTGYYKKYDAMGNDLGPATSSDVAGGQLGPNEQKRIAPQAKAYATEAQKEESKLTNIQKGMALIDDPKAKGIGQNTALMSLVRDSISSASRMNQTELQNVTGLPDMADRLSRLSNKLLNGETLSDDDKTAVKAVFKASAAETSQNIENLKQTFVGQAQAALPDRPYPLVYKHVTGRELPAMPAGAPGMPASAPAPNRAPAAPPALSGPVPGAVAPQSTPSGLAPLSPAGSDYLKKLQQGG